MVWRGPPSCRDIGDLGNKALVYPASNLPCLPGTSRHFACRSETYIYTWQQGVNRIALPGSDDPIQSKGVHNEKKSVKPKEVICIITPKLSHFNYVLHSLWSSLQMKKAIIQKVWQTVASLGCLGKSCVRPLTWCLPHFRIKCHLNCTKFRLKGHLLFTQNS